MGAGSALLGRLLDQAPVRNLVAWVEKENRKGRRFYEKHGFHAVEEIEEEFMGFRTRTLRCLLVLETKQNRPEM
ncbi:GNAT family N-acetyltransferase [Melghirimyces profundicolus]|uniref:GNAT family N-acetyltransferase n=1 Tax=Melghirimyces profundicolus TaxID=1242148 RepID=UPI002481E25C|nr:GNAT family N-acetyltransferase [Melghirimyces profundicolus]